MWKEIKRFDHGSDFVVIVSRRQHFAEVSDYTISMGVERGTGLEQSTISRFIPMTVVFADNTGKINLVRLIEEAVLYVRERIAEEHTALTLNQRQREKEEAERRIRAQEKKKRYEDNKKRRAEENRKASGNNKSGKKEKKGGAK
jgi:hypothetical protein